MERLYCVFFMFHQTCFAVREVDPETTATTVEVPYDTQFFLFVEADSKETVTRNIYYLREPKGGTAWAFDFLVKIPVRDHTCYVIGSPATVKIEGHEDEDFIEGAIIRKLISPSEITYEGLKKRHFDTSKVYETSHFDTFFDAKVKVVLESDGTITASTSNVYKFESSDLFADFYGMCMKIDAVAREFPEIYDDILGFIDETEHIYYERLAKFCRCRRAIVYLKRYDL